MGGWVGELTTQVAKASTHACLLERPPFTSGLKKGLLGAGEGGGLVERSL